MRARQIACGVVLALTAVAEPAGGEPQPPSTASDRDRAAQLASEAEQLGQEKRFVAALAKYKEAARLDPDTPAYQCNIGMAYYALASYPRAHLYLLRCRQVSGGWPPGVEAVFQYVVRDLAGQDYTPITISGAPAAQVTISYYADEGPFAAPVTAYLPFGRYEVTARAAGYRTGFLSVNASSRAAAAASYDLTPAPAAGAEAGGGGHHAAASTAVDVDERAPTAPRGRWPLWVAAGGAAIGAAGIGFFALAKHHQRELTDNSSDNVYVGSPGTYDDQKHLMRRDEVLAYAAWSVGGAAVAAGLYLYFGQSADPPSGAGGVAVSAGPLPGGGAVLVSGRFGGEGAGP